MREGFGNRLGRQQVNTDGNTAQQQDEKPAVNHFDIHFEEEDIEPHTGNYWMMTKIKMLSKLSATVKSTFIDCRGLSLFIDQNGRQIYSIIFDGATSNPNALYRAFEIAQQKKAEGVIAVYKQRITKPKLYIPTQEGIDFLSKLIVPRDMTGRVLNNEKDKDGRIKDFKKYYNEYVAQVINPMTGQYMADPQMGGTYVQVPVDMNMLFTVCWPKEYKEKEKYQYYVSPLGAVCEWQNPGNPVFIINEVPESKAKDILNVVMPPAMGYGYGIPNTVLNEVY